MKECKDTDGKDPVIHNENKRIASVSQCALVCKASKASMFAFGTNDYGEPSCNDKGCQCICEISAASNGTCEQEFNKGFRLFRYKPTGKSTPIVSQLFFKLSIFS